MDIGTTGLVGLACFLSSVSPEQADNVYAQLNQDQQAIVAQVEQPCLPAAFESAISESKNNLFNDTQPCRTVGTFNEDLED
jgi:hypothetical protein